MTVRRQHGGTCLRNPQILDGLGALPHEKPAQCANRDVAPRPVLQHEARHEDPRRAWITSGDAGLAHNGTLPPILACAAALK
jgi:hypothetical protein